MSFIYQNIQRELQNRQLEKWRLKINTWLLFIDDWNEKSARNELACLTVRKDVKGEVKMDFRPTNRFPRWLSGEEFVCQAGDMGQEDSLEKKMATHSNILAWKSCEQRNVAGHSPWGLKETDMTQWLKLQVKRRWWMDREKHKQIFVSSRH